MAAVPELPDLTAYLVRLEERVLGQPIQAVRVASPFIVRTAEPPIQACVGKRVLSLSRLGKRLVFGLEDEHFIVLHLMIAGRLRWLKRGAKLPGRIGLLGLDFPGGTLALTEAGTTRRAALHLVVGKEGLAPFQRGGLEVLDASYEAFAEVVRRENHTLKRTLTDPRLMSAIGNAYSDEILFAARLSPVKLTSALSDDEIRRLYDATQATLRDWIARLLAEPGWPEKVTAFREGMAVHGRYRQPCLVCGSPVQRIRYAENETNYCAKCQNAGRLLADRALSRLLHGDWPRTLAELEELRARRID